jgi:hypothetical protein
MEHIKTFLNKKLNDLKRKAAERSFSVQNGTLTEAGARLMALGSERPIHSAASRTRLYQL